MKTDNLIPFLLRIKSRSYQLEQILFLMVLLNIVYPSEAHAYLDPGTLGYLLQLIIGALIGTAIAGKVFWGKIKAFFVKTFSKRVQD